MWKVNGRRMPSDCKSSHCLWQGELKRKSLILILNQDCQVVNEKSSLRKTVPIMTWFTFTENLCQDDRICSVWRSHTSFSIMHDLLPNMNYQRIKTICNTTVGTSGAGTFYSSGKYDFSPPLVLMGFTLFHLCFLCIVCGPLIVCLSLSSVL